MSTPAQDFSPKEKAHFQDTVNEAVHRALIDKSGVLINTLQNVIKNTMDGKIVKEPYKRPVYFNIEASGSGTKVDDMTLPKMPPPGPMNENVQTLMNTGLKTPPPDDNRLYTEIPAGYHYIHNYSGGMRAIPGSVLHRIVLQFPSDRCNRILDMCLMTGQDR